MAEVDRVSPPSVSTTVDASLVSYTHIIYALHATSVAIGVLGAPTIVGAFLLGIPSIIAVIMNYLRRGDVRGGHRGGAVDPSGWTRRKLGST